VFDVDTAEGDGEGVHVFVGYGEEVGYGEPVGR